MYPASFDYHRVTTVDEAVALLQEHGPDAKVLAGGHSLLPMMKLRLAAPTVLIDIGRIASMRGIRREGDSFVIGALTTQAAIHASPDIWEGATALAEAAGQLGDTQVRNVATIGGNIAHADPASDIPAVFLALEGEAVISGPDGQRTVKATDFFQGMFETKLDSYDVLTTLHLPVQRSGEGSAYIKFANPASGYAVVGVAVWLRMEETSGTRRIGAARIAVNGVLDHAVRLTNVEEALKGYELSEEKFSFSSVTSHAIDGLHVDEFMSDLHASAEYRAYLLHLLLDQALVRAAERANSTS